MADKQRYLVLIGINYPPNNQRAGIGSVVDDIPDLAITVDGKATTTIANLIAHGIVEPTDKPLNRIDDTAGEPMAFGAAVETKPPTPPAVAGPAPSSAPQQQAAPEVAPVDPTPAAPAIVTAASTPGEASVAGASTGAPTTAATDPAGDAGAKGG